MAVGTSKAVHQIAIKKAGGFNLISIADWKNLTGPGRVELIVQQKVQFLDVDGDEIPAKEALQYLKQAG